MRIDSVDFFFVSMPTVTLDADGSQDALLVRVTADGDEGWGECEASPLVSIAAFITPRSHGACQPVEASVIGQHLAGPEDIPRISAEVRRASMDLLQAPHTLSGIEIALWDLLGRVRGEPVWRMLGFTASHPKTPYASVLFGETPAETYRTGRALADLGFRGVKFGWGPFGTGTVAADAEHLEAAREAIGQDGLLFVDAGQIWGDDVEAASARLDALRDTRATWIEEPFEASEFEAYAELGARSSWTRVAGGEASHSEAMARNLLRYGRVGYLQIDTGRIGGIGPAHRVALLADREGATYVNHTFTSHLALSASLQPFAGLEQHTICEFPADPSALATAITTTHLELDADGQITAPDAPGLGLDVDTAALTRFERRVHIDVDDETLFRSTPFAELAGAGATR